MGNKRNGVFKQLLYPNYNIEKICKSFEDRSLEKPSSKPRSNPCADVTHLSHEMLSEAYCRTGDYLEKIRVGDRVYIVNDDLGCIYPRFAKFIIKYGTEEEKAYWVYDKFPEKGSAFTISSINPHLWLDKEIAILVRRVPEEGNPNFIEVYMVDISGLERVK